MTPPLTTAAGVTTSRVGVYPIYHLQNLGNLAYTDPNYTSRKHAVRGRQADDPAGASDDHRRQPDASLWRGEPLADLHATVASSTTSGAESRIDRHAQYFDPRNRDQPGRVLPDHGQGRDIVVAELHVYVRVRHADCGAGGPDRHGRKRDPHLRRLNPTLTCNITGFVNNQTAATSDLTGTPGVSISGDPGQPGRVLSQ